MTLRECSCDVPRPYGAPQKAHACASCGYWINPAWTVNDKTMGEFWARLRGAIPHETAVDLIYPHSDAREREGRRLYGLRYLGRDCAFEGMEEAADGPNYAAMELLRARRAKEDEEWALALTAAHHFALAYQALAAMRGHTHRPYSDPGG